MKQYVVAGIFARGGSRGIPRKNVRMLAGKPLIAWAIETARAVRDVDRVFVSTDDEEIARVAREFGADVPFTRPVELAGDDAPEWAAWQHALHALQREPGSMPIDAFVCVPTTSPLRKPEDVDACLQCLLDTDADLVLTVRPAQRNPYFNMVTLDDSGLARLVIPPLAVVHTRQQAPEVYDIATVAYAARPAFVLRANSAFDGRVRAVVVPAERSLDIDTEFDLRVAECLMAGTH